jgi:hypothetical protein
MKRIRLIAFFASVLLTTISVNADTLPGGTITLLPGFHLDSAKKCLDSCGGRIWKDGGLSISYENGLDAGIYAEAGKNKKDARWTQEQRVNGQRVLIVFTRKKELIISFPDGPANFRASVRNDREIAEMLLTVLTFEGRANTTH